MTECAWNLFCCLQFKTEFC